MPALRCSLCALNYPNDPKRFRACPRCEEETAPFSNVRAMPENEAQSILDHCTFELFYAKWDAQKGPLEAREC